MIGLNAQGVRMEMLQDWYRWKDWSLYLQGAADRGEFDLRDYPALRPILLGDEKLITSEPMDLAIAFELERALQELGIDPWEDYPQANGKGIYRHPRSKDLGTRIALIHCSRKMLHSTKRYREVIGSTREPAGGQDQFLHLPALDLFYVNRPMTSLGRLMRAGVNTLFPGTGVTAGQIGQWLIENELSPTERLFYGIRFFGNDAGRMSFNPQMPGVVKDGASLICFDSGKPVTRLAALKVLRAAIPLIENGVGGELRATSLRNFTAIGAAIGVGQI